MPGVSSRSRGGAAGLDRFPGASWKRGEGVAGGELGERPNRRDSATRRSSGTRAQIRLSSFGWRRGFCGGFLQSRDVRQPRGREIAGDSGFSAKSRQDNVERVYTFPAYKPNFGRSAIVTDQADPRTPGQSAIVTGQADLRRRPAEAPAEATCGGAFTQSFLHPRTL
jgi:hypothetical protein